MQTWFNAACLVHFIGVVAAQFVQSRFRVAMKRTWTSWRVNLGICRHYSPLTRVDGTADYGSLGEGLARQVREGSIARMSMQHEA